MPWGKIILAVVALYVGKCALELVDVREQAKSYVRKQCIGGYEFWESSFGHADGEWHSHVLIYDDKGSPKECQ